MSRASKWERVPTVGCDVSKYGNKVHFPAKSKIITAAVILAPKFIFPLFSFQISFSVGFSEDSLLRCSARSSVTEWRARMLP